MSSNPQHPQSRPSDHRDAESSRRHRWLGEQLDLFHFPAHAPGMASWHPKGMVMLDVLHAYVRELNRRYGYQEVRSPIVCDHALWERSGHLDKFADKMFHMRVDGRRSALRPMNCPGHCDLYDHRPRSWRELPMRIAEQGHVHRVEQSGELNGLLRARSFVIDDGHLFCAPEHVDAELAACLAMIGEVYDLFGLEPLAELSLRPEQRLGDDALWDRAEDGLRAASSQAGIAFVEQAGEGAFYGPKVDVHVADSLGRAWQMGSVQLDYQLPERLDLRYVAANGTDRDEDGRPHRPIIIHRALLGSFERFVAILLEHFDGRFPLWLAPEAVRVLPIGANQRDYAQEVVERLEGASVRAALVDDGPLAGRIRAAQSARVPVLAVIGEREQDATGVALRRGPDQRLLPLDTAVSLLADEVAQRRLESGR
jgi:threonyl-tRNA synthetase